MIDWIAWMNKLDIYKINIYINSSSDASIWKTGCTKKIPETIWAVYIFLTFLEQYTVSPIWLVTAIIYAREHVWEISAIYWFN